MVQNLAIIVLELFSNLIQMNFAKIGSDTFPTLSQNGPPFAKSNVFYILLAYNFCFHYFAVDSITLI